MSRQGPSQFVRPSIAALIALVVAMLALSACAGSSSATATATVVARTSIATPNESTGAAQQLQPGSITVFAAASLTDSFADIGKAFSAAHAGVDVTYNFGGSPTLRTQLEQGARADVLALADQANMQAALDAKLVVDAGTIFATNRLVIIAPAANPGGVNAPIDLAKPGLKLVLALDGVPAGTYARQSFAKMATDPAFGAGFTDAVLANVVSEEPNVKGVVTKVQLGEADAGVVYVTDVTPGVAADVHTVAIPEAVNSTAEYPIAVTRTASRTDLADAFVAFVASAEGQSIVRKYGFLSLR